MAHYGQFPNRGGPIRAFDGKASVMTQNRQVKEAATIRLHSKTFSSWVNVHLRKRQLRVNDVTTDFADGLLLIQLVEILSNKQCNIKYNRKPILEIQKVENVSIALQFINNFTKVNVNPKDIVSGNSKVILAVLWRLIIAFQMKSNNSNSSSAAAMKREVKAKLLGWIKEKTGMNVTDCDRSFDNGVIFCHLLHAFDSSLINLARVNPNQPRDNLELSFQLIEQHLHIPRMLAVEDMQNPDITARPDEQCIMTYLFQFPEAFLQKPTPEAISVNVDLQPLPTNLSGYNTQTNSPSIESSHSNSGSAHSSTVSNPNTYGTSPSNFPQAPNNSISTQKTEEKRNTRYHIGDNVPLPPSVEISSLDALSGQSTPTSNSNVNPIDTQSFNTTPYNNSPTNKPNPEINSGIQSLGGSPAYLSNISNSNSPASRSPQINNQNQQTSYQSNNQNLYGNQTSNLQNNPQVPYGNPVSSYSDNNLHNQQTNPVPNNSQLSGQSYGTGMNQPQRPPPPSSGFGDFYATSTPNVSSTPQRPPPPSTAAFGLDSNQFNPNMPRSNSDSVFNSQTSSEPDWKQKELELKQREEEFRKQQEDFLRKKQEYEKELEKLKRESMNLAKNPMPPPNSSSSVAKLIVGVLAARNLMPGMITRNPYAVLIVDNQKDRTTVIKKTINPQWNVEFTFYIENPNWSINITIYDKNKLKHDDFLGKVVIPIKQLQEGIQREDWLTLQPKKAGASVSGEIRLKFLLTR